MMEAAANLAIKHDGPESRGRPKRNSALCLKTVCVTPDLRVKLRRILQLEPGAQAAATPWSSAAFDRTRTLLLILFF